MQRRPYVKTVHGVDAVEHARFDQALRAAARRFFLRRLADKQYRPGQLVPQFAENLRRPQQDCHMAVMAAGMHLPLPLGRKRQACLFRNG